MWPIVVSSGEKEYWTHRRWVLERAGVGQCINNRSNSVLYDFLWHWNPLIGEIEMMNDVAPKWLYHNEIVTNAYKAAVAKELES